MRSRSSPVLFFGFGSLVVLIGLAGLGSARRAAQLFAEMDAISRAHRESTRIFDEIRSGVNLSGIFVRDYLLDPSDLTAFMHRQKLLEIRAGMAKELEQLKRLEVRNRKASSPNSTRNWTPTGTPSTRCSPGPAGGEEPWAASSSSRGCCRGATPPWR